MDEQEAVEVAFAIGPAAETCDSPVKMPNEFARVIEQDLAELAKEYKQGDGKIVAPASAWIVTAYSPRLGCRRGPSEIGAFVDQLRLTRDVEPVERQHVIRCLGDETVAQLGIGQHLLGHLRERLGVARAEAQADVVGRHDLAQSARVGDDARAAAGHRLERDQPERLVDRRNDREVGDPVERVQHVVADPADERAVLHQAELLGLVLQFLFVRAGAGDDEADLADVLDQRLGSASSATWKPFS